MLTLIAIGLAFAVVRASTASPTMSAPSAVAPRVVVLDRRAGEAAKIDTIERFFQRPDRHVVESEEATPDRAPHH